MHGRLACSTPLRNSKLAPRLKGSLKVSECFGGLHDPASAIVVDVADAPIAPETHSVHVPLGANESALLLQVV